MPAYEATAEPLASIAEEAPAAQGMPPDRAMQSSQTLKTAVSLPVSEATSLERRTKSMTRQRAEGLRAKGQRVKSLFDAASDATDPIESTKLRETRPTGCVVDPRKSVWSSRWDLLMLACLIFTAIVTPVEIAFLAEGEKITYLWIVNRVIDLCFFLDLCLSFVIATQVEPDRGGYYIVNQRVLIYNYLTGWFLIDALSLLPVWLITLDYDSPWAYSNSSLEEARASAALAAPAGLTPTPELLPRVMRLSRLLKLARVLKASRVLQRNLLDIFMHRFGATYAVVKIIKLIGILIIFAHWQACLWGMAAVYTGTGGADNWITDYELGGEISPVAAIQWYDRYVAALYWSIMVRVRRSLHMHTQARPHAAALSDF